MDRMKKWILLGVLALFALVIWAGVDLVLDIMKDREQGLAEARKVAQQMTGWKIVAETRFHGQAPYFIFTMQDQHGELYYLVVDEQNRGQYFPFKELAWDEEKVREQVKREYGEWHIKAIRPAFVYPEMCWEVVLVDSEETWHYIYYSMKNGQFIKRFTLSDSLRS